MRSPIQIGITGGIGAGKSLVCKIFQCLGIAVYDADGHAKELMTTDVILVSNIKKEFGELSYNTKGTLNREYLSLKVFKENEKLKRLNELVHPRVAEHYKRWVERNENCLYLVKEAALLFEAGSDKLLDKVVVVYAPETLRIQRVLARDSQRSEDQVRAIIDKQMSEEEKMERADFIIRNDEKELVIPQVVKLHNEFLSLSGRFIPET